MAEGRIRASSADDETEAEEGRRFGAVSGVSPSAVFSDRKALAESRVHRPRQAGISGSEGGGADSIVVSGGYEDDEDYGDVIIYTGHGGQENGVQIADQDWSRGNLALVKSEIEGLPIRVVRGAGGDPSFSPASGYRYDGLYYVERSWQEPGRSGYRVCRFRLRRLKEDGTPAPSPPDYMKPPITNDGPAPRVEATVQRLVRSTPIALHVKALHRHACQICGDVVRVAGGPYAEGAHIRPLGKPHNGPDVPGNILCLCPNDHVRFDLGGIIIRGDLKIRNALTGETLGQLRTVPGHDVDLNHLAYHRSRFT